MSEDRPWTRPPRYTRHPNDGACPYDHTVGAVFLSHTHVIEEKWSHGQKQAVADHIDRWHFPVSPKRGG